MIDLHNHSYQNQCLGDFKVSLTLTTQEHQPPGTCSAAGASKGFANFQQLYDFVSAILTAGPEHFGDI